MYIFYEVILGGMTVSLEQNQIYTVVKMRHDRFAHARRNELNTTDSEKFRN